MIMRKRLVLLILSVFTASIAGAVDYDLNGDGVVNQADYDLLAARIVNITASYNSRYDLNNDGNIDAVDANMMLSYDEFGSKLYTVNGVSFKMVEVEGGTFTMGATAEQGSDGYDSEAYDSEKPVHQVTLSSYSIGQTEVTQELWLAVMGSNPSRFTGNLQRPVECVSWDDCQTFITKLNQLTGKSFRLPTEAEWEYAARGGNRSQGYKYAGSNNSDEVAWYFDNGFETHSVATKASNELGLYDMSGNVWEWCQDWDGSYSSDAQTNPTGPASGSHRMCRGGSWCNLDWNCRVSCRNIYAPSRTFDHLGLRLAF